MALIEIERMLLTERINIAKYIYIILYRELYLQLNNPAKNNFQIEGTIRVNRMSPLNVSSKSVAALTQPSCRIFKSRRTRVLQFPQTCAELQSDTVTVFNTGKHKPCSQTSGFSWRTTFGFPVSSTSRRAVSPSLNSPLARLH